MGDDLDVPTGIDDLLDWADRCLAAGRHRAAIDGLTAANRRVRDPRLEERLVTLRSGGFHASTPPGEGLPRVTVVAEASADLDPVDPSDLTVERLREGMAQDGCVWVSGLISEDRAARLRSDIDSVLAAFDDGSRGASPAETTPWYRPFTPGAGEFRVGGRRKWMRESGGVWAVDSPRMLFELCELLDETGIGALATEFLGERPALSGNKCNLRRVPVSTATNWHQDGAFLGADVASLNLWLALGPCGRDAPGLDVLPRRLDRIVETGTEGAMFDWSVAPDVVAGLENGAAVTSPEFAAGDALLFDHYFLHRTGIRPEMTRERHAIECWMFGPSGYPDGQIPILY